MTFDPAIPQATDLLSNSQQDLLDNFSQLNTQFGIDHTAFNTGSGNGDGFHKKVTFPSAPVIAAPAGTKSIVYPKAVSAIQELHFQNSTKEIQITDSGLTASSGQGFLPGGLQIRCGSGTASAGAGTLNTITPQFPTATLSVTANTKFGNNTIGIGTTNPTDFIATSNSGTVSIFWTAIGY